MRKVVFKALYDHGNGRILNQSDYLGHYCGLRGWQRCVRACARKISLGFGHTTLMDHRCSFSLGHFICAYQFYHHWSHESAYLDTARQTDEVIGLNWGGGLFINYAFLTIWTIDVAWWWLRGLASYRTRPWPLVAAWHGFMIFILFNAMVVFKEGPTRWVGLVICMVLLLSWARIARHGLTPILKTAKA